MQIGDKMNEQKQKKITERYERVLANLKLVEELRREIEKELKEILRKGDKK